MMVNSIYFEISNLNGTVVKIPMIFNKKTQKFSIFAQFSTWKSCNPHNYQTE